MAIRIAKLDMFKSGTDYDYTHSYIRGYDIDWEKMSGALKRQSKKGGDFTNVESRLHQEDLTNVAINVRPDHNPAKVKDYDEGAGVSGQKKIYQRPKMTEFWGDLCNDRVGSMFVAREDRLFRDRHGTQPGAFTEKCQEKHCILIVAGKRRYDFSRDDDLSVFKKRMDEAAAYLRHVRYMNDMQRKKQARGEWAGGGIVAPYVIDKIKQTQIKEFIKQQRMMGLLASDIDYTEEMSQAYRPIIYQPWLERARELFSKMKLFNYELPRLMRYIEEKPHIFPFPSAEDRMKFHFGTNMRKNQGGYTFGSIRGAENWFTNLSHLGWMIAGRDEESREPIYLEDCFQGAILREEFEEMYIQLRGEDLDGNLIERVRNKARFTREAPRGKTDALLSRCFQSEYDLSTQNTTLEKGSGWYACRTKPYQKGTISENMYLTHIMWVLPIRPFDKAIVERLSSLAEHDQELAKRVRAFFASQQQGDETNKKLITDDIAALQQQNAHLHRLITTGLGFSDQQLAKFGKEQREVERKIEEAQKALEKVKERKPEEVIPRFYDILGNIIELFWKQDLDHRRKMLRLLVKNVQVERIAPHVYSLCVNWIDPVAARPDTGLIYTGSSPMQRWSTEEEETLRAIYPQGEKQEILQIFPDSSWDIIVKRASKLGIKRKCSHTRLESDPFYRWTAYNDWIKTCEYYGIEQEKEREEILEMLLNYSAKTKKQELVFLWLLPAAKITLRAQLESIEGNIMTHILGGNKSSATSP